MKRKQKRTVKGKNKTKKALIISTVETKSKSTVFGARMKPDGQIMSLKLLTEGEEDPGEWLFCGC